MPSLKITNCNRFNVTKKTSAQVICIILVVNFTNAVILPNSWCDLHAIHILEYAIHMLTISWKYGSGISVAASLKNRCRAPFGKKFNLIF